MLGFTSYSEQISQNKIGDDKYARNQWDDLVTAIHLLKNFNEELLKLHPFVVNQIKMLINS